MKKPEILILCRLAVFAALGKSAGLEKLARSVSFQRIPSKKIRETLLEVHLFAGFPAAIEAVAALRVSMPLISERKTTSMSINQRSLRGTDVCRRVYAGKYDNLVKTLEQLDPELSNWILDDGYGSRSGLSLR